MEPILINRTKNDLTRQINFIERLENPANKAVRRKLVIFFIVITSFEICLFLLSPSNTFVTLKAVSSVLVTICLAVVFFPFALYYLIKQFRKRTRVKRWVAAILKKTEKLYIVFDDEKLIYTSDNYTSEIKWTYYKAYMEESDIIYIFPEGSTYNMHSFSASEIGQDNLDQLKQIVKAKLPILEFKKPPNRL